MQLEMDRSLIKGYKSISQQTRVITEDWFLNESYCPSCGESVRHYESNKPVADFYCKKCSSDFELKSKSIKFSNRIVDGAFRTMKERLESDTNPSLFFMTYKNYLVENLVLVPKHFFVMDIIEKRKPLSEKARRAGWIGCNILLQEIPDSGKIYYIKNSVVKNKSEVLDIFSKTAFLKDENRQTKGWIIDIMRCIEKTEKRNFKLADIYMFDKFLADLHPENRNVRPKIRQQLQILRDRGYLHFEGNGHYALI